MSLTDTQKARLKVAEELTKEQFATASALSKISPFAAAGFPITTADVAAIALVLATNYQTQVLVK